jgi:hypothetical protein
VFVCGKYNLTFGSIGVLVLPLGFTTGLTHSDWKGLPGRNTLAYFSSLSVAKKQVFITLTTGVNVIKRFSFAADDEAK